MNKVARQQTILELLRRGPVSSQGKLQHALRKRGVRVGQATLSRDIRELRLSKQAAGYGLIPGEASAAPPLPPIAHLIHEFVLNIRQAQNLLVIKTITGSAQPVAAALDEQGWEEVLGTVAGDDTILMVCAGARDARKAAARLQEMLA